MDIFVDFTMSELKVTWFIIRYKLWFIFKRNATDIYQIPRKWQIKTWYFPICGHSSEYVADFREQKARQAVVQ